MAGGGFLAGKIAVITGSGAGIGKAMAHVFVREGAKVLAVDFSGAQNAVADTLGAAVIPCHADVSKEEEVEAMFAAAIASFGRVDVLVNNAATIGGLRPEISAEEYEVMTTVNLRGLMLCCKHAIRAMRQAGGGSIVNVASIAGLNTESQTSIVYAATKSGVISVTKSLAVHHGAEGIRVNAIAPGLTRTEKQMSQPQQWHDMAAGKAPLGRVARPEEQAEVAAFLASDRASFVSGVTIPVDGGWSARLA